MLNSDGASRAVSINPATGERFATHPWLTDAQLEAALERVERATLLWGTTTIAERARLLEGAAVLLRQQAAALSRMISLEMGKPIVEAESEIEKSAWNCEFVARNAEGWLADEEVPTSASLSYISYRPLGAILSILPWNFPVWQIFRCAASALMAGNVVLLKHAPNVLGCAAMVTELLQRAGIPEGVFENLAIPTDRVARLIEDRRVAAVTLTGSPAAGSAVAAQAGAACKKSVLELGGSDAFIVLDDADLDAAVRAAVTARFANCGQVCLAAKRFILTQGIAGEFEQRLTEAVAALRIGDPLDRTTRLGPLARADLRRALHRQVTDSIAAGARLVAGAREVPGDGFFYEPTILSDVTGHMTVAAQETFGPVAALLRARGSEEAMALANSSAYGLGCVMWTRDIERARSLARRAAAGGVFINGVTASDPRLPVGGVKLSGYGRELGAVGMRELTNIQSVWIGPPRAR